MLAVVNNLDWSRPLGSATSCCPPADVLMAAAEGGASLSRYGSQWALNGETWAVGCPVPPSALFPELNKLVHDQVGGAGADLGGKRNVRSVGAESEAGVRAEDGEEEGVARLSMVWGGDEYLYHVLRRSGPTAVSLPTLALSMLRMIRCEPWWRDDDGTAGAGGGVYAWVGGEEDDMVRELLQHYSSAEAAVDQETLDLPLLGTVAGTISTTACTCSTGASGSAAASGSNALTELRGNLKFVTHDPQIWMYYSSLVDKYCRGQLLW